MRTCNRTHVFRDKNFNLYGGIYRCELDLGHRGWHYAGNDNGSSVAWATGWALVVEWLREWKYRNDRKGVKEGGA